MKRKRIAILGSTGSIGRQTIDVMRLCGGMEVCALGAGANWRLLAAQARKLGTRIVAVADESAEKPLRQSLGARVKVLAGPAAMTEMVRLSEPDVLLSGVVGTAGLEPTLEAIKCGSTLAIANKETLVAAGEIVMSAARKAGVAVLPVDSEHSAIFQCLQAGRRDEVRRVVITSSGGALRDWSDSDAARATVREALNHPTWNMGRKVTIDSATLVNKALEVIEAHWLFGLRASEIDVLMHPESIVHSLVEFRDGSVVAQLGEPDMTLPIAYALNYPRRLPRRFRPLDLASVGSLTFRKPAGRFLRAVSLGHAAIRRGGLCGAVLNAANESAVKAFIEGRIPLGMIVPLVERMIKKTPEVDEVDLPAVVAAGRWAALETEKAIASCACPVRASRKRQR